MLRTARESDRYLRLLIYSNNHQHTYQATTTEVEPQTCLHTSRQWLKVKIIYTHTITGDLNLCPHQDLSQGPFPCSLFLHETKVMNLLVYLHHFISWYTVFSTHSVVSRFFKSYPLTTSSFLLFYLMVRFWPSLSLRLYRGGSQQSQDYTAL